MRLTSIASGSSGNCIYIGTDNTHLLVDAGISCKRIVAGLTDLSIKPEEVGGILITHEHSDHIQGLGVLSRKYGIPIYATPGTTKGILSYSSLGKFDESLVHPITCGVDFTIGDIVIEAFPIPHDANEPCAFVASHGKKKVAVATDIGMYDEEIVRHLSGLDALLLEANHDVKMLQVGSYPYYLKQRILGNRGHLSNENSGRLLSRILHDRFQGVLLGHLSKENNYERLAYETVKMEVTLGDCPYNGDDFPIAVAKRDEPSEIIFV
ncbi:MAG: MBL fold metallo-hydrolase [Lachnospiraceae bacterium]|jgi:phosphoribosyl 1,2-cyclic phosphodiesterase|nr:MBL fold metallo-hydrolase [Lachnospiraceae bacterium]